MQIPGNKAASSSMNVALYEVLVVDVMSLKSVGSVLTAVDRSMFLDLDPRIQDSIVSVRPPLMTIKRSNGSA